MKIRSFIAVDLSPGVLERIAGMVGRIEKETRGFRWVRPEGIHLTLRFLGEVEEEILSTIGQRIEPLARDEAPLSFTASGIGFFPNPARPRVVWVGLHGEIARLEGLQKKIGEAMAGLPVHQEKERPFAPHLTIARIPDVQRCSGIARILQEKSAEFGDFRIESIGLYKSRLTPKGAEYTKLRDFKLGRV